MTNVQIGNLSARYGLVIVIAWFGGMKFTNYEAQGIAPLVADFDRVWGNRAPRGREILEIVQEMGPSTP